MSQENRPQVARVELELAGRTLSIETGLIAQQADGAAVVRYGDSTVLSTVVGEREPNEAVGFFPLTVDYEERMYAAGKIPGGFIKREGRPTEAATLAARLTDRPIRPLFPKGYKAEVQVITTVMSADQENDPDILSIIGASTALTLSQIPVGRSDRRGADGIHRRAHRHQPDVVRSRRQRARYGRGRHQRRDHDGRGRIRPGFRGRSSWKASSAPTTRSGASSNSSSICSARPARRSGNLRRRQPTRTSKSRSGSSSAIACERPSIARTRFFASRGRRICGRNCWPSSPHRATSRAFRCCARTSWTPSRTS